MLRLNMSYHNRLKPTISPFNEALSRDGTDLATDAIVNLRPQGSPDLSRPPDPPRPRVAKCQIFYTDNNLYPKKSA